MTDEHPFETIPLAEESVTVGKRRIMTGRVRVKTATHQHEELISQDLARDSVEVDRVPINREVDSMPQVRQEGDLTIVPIVEEVLFVEKRLVLKEEVHIRRSRSLDHVETPIVLQKQEAVIERLAADGSAINEDLKP